MALTVALLFGNWEVSAIVILIRFLFGIAAVPPLKISQDSQAFWLFRTLQQELKHMSDITLLPTPFMLCLEEVKIFKIGLKTLMHFTVLMNILYVMGARFMVDFKMPIKLYNKAF